MSSLLDLINGNGHSGNGATAQPTRYALAYLRVSTDDQDEQAQRRDIERWAADNNVVILDWHADHASKANDDVARAQFWQAVERAKSDPRITLFLVWDAWRFYRNRHKASKVKAELYEASVNVVTVTAFHDPDSDIAPVMDGLYEGLAEQESRKTRARTMNRMMHNCTQRDPETEWCYWNGGQPIFGYKTVQLPRGTDRKGRPKHKTVVLPDDAEQCGRTNAEWAKTLLLEWRFKEGLGFDALRDRLNCLGIRPRRGEYWSTSTVWQLCTEKSLLFYAGWYVWNVNAMKWLGEDTGKKKKDKGEWVKVENHHPALITLEQAEEIHRSCPRYPGRGGSHARSQDSRFLLSGGLFVCGRCGANMTGFDVWTKDKGKVSVYVCGAFRYRKGAGCGHAFYVPQLDTETAVYQLITEGALMPDEDLRDICRLMNEMKRQEWEAQAAQVGGAARRLKEVESEIQNLMDAIRKGVSPELVAEESHRLHAERERLRQQAETEKVKPFRPVTVADLRRWNTLLERAYQRADNAQKRALIRCYVTKMEVAPEQSAIDVWLDEGAMWSGAITEMVGCNGNSTEPTFIRLVAPRSATTPLSVCQPYSTTPKSPYTFSLREGGMVGMLPV